MSISTEYPDGIKAYEQYVLTTVVYFPKGNVKCEWCKFLTRDNNSGSYRCSCTADTIYFKDKGVGLNCPLERITDDSI